MGSATALKVYRSCNRHGLRYKNGADYFITRVFFVARGSIGTRDMATTDALQLFRKGGEPMMLSLQNKNMCVTMNVSFLSPQLTQGPNANGGEDIRSPPIIDNSPQPTRSIPSLHLALTTARAPTDGRRADRLPNQTPTSLSGMARQSLDAGGMKTCRPERRRRKTQKREICPPRNQLSALS